MFFKVNNNQPIRPVVAFLAHTGELLIRTRNGDYNVLYPDGLVSDAYTQFDLKISVATGIKIYQGDTVTIQF